MLVVSHRLTTSIVRNSQAPKRAAGVEGFTMPRRLRGSRGLFPARRQDPVQPVEHPLVEERARPRLAVLARAFGVGEQHVLLRAGQRLVQGLAAAGAAIVLRLREER